MPATTANLGSGFDTLGLALGLYNEVEWCPDASAAFGHMKIDIIGEGKDTLSTTKENFILQAMREVASIIGKEIPGGQMKLVNRIPLARGLGSSSAALVAGAMLVNAFAGNPLTQKEILDITANMEGHPDNVAPAVMGGFCISFMDGQSVCIEKVDMRISWKAVVAIPEFELHTEQARSVLPETYTRSEAIYNIGRVSLLISAFSQNKGEWLKEGLCDKIHVPYRLPLIRGAKEAMNRAMEAGSLGCTISGSGPTLISFCAAEKADRVGVAMVAGFKEKDVDAKYRILDFDTMGATTI